MCLHHSWLSSFVAFVFYSILLLCSLSRNASTAGSPHEIAVTAVDASGNRRACTFDVLVEIDETKKELTHDMTAADWAFPASAVDFAPVALGVSTSRLEPSPTSDISAFQVCVCVCVSVCVCVCACVRGGVPLIHLAFQPENHSLVE